MRSYLALTISSVFGLVCFILAIISFMNGYAFLGIMALIMTVILLAYFALSMANRNNYKYAKEMRKLEKKELKRQQESIRKYGFDINEYDQNIQNQNNDNNENGHYQNW